MSGLLFDSFGRNINYLRISITDRCNFRCVYCVTAEDPPLMARSDILSFEETTRVARIFLAMGGRKLKLTGGEPLSRRGVEQLVASLARLDGLEDMGLTTNGFALKTLARPLFDAGLRRLNVSLDSMNPSRFAALTRSNTFERVWEGIQEAIVVGFKLKINAVVLKGITHDELTDFGTLAYTHPVDVRFIEYMPLCGSGWQPERALPMKTVEGFFKDRYELAEVPRGSSTAKTYRLLGGRGRVGFIASMTEPFCDRCSRLRLTANGRLRNCLFSNGEVDLKAALREGATDRMIEDLIRKSIREKPKGHGISPKIQDASRLPLIRPIGG